MKQQRRKNMDKDNDTGNKVDKIDNDATEKKSKFKKKAKTSHYLSFNNEEE